MSSRSDLLPVSEILELPFRRGEVGVIFLLAHLSHGMNQYPVAVGHGRDDARGDIFLGVKDRQPLPVSIISLGPKLRPGPSIDQLRDDSNTRASFANAPFQGVARVRGAGHDREISKSRQSGGHILDQTFG